MFNVHLCGDESTWLFAGWGEARADIVKRGLEKPGGRKGGHTLVLTDVDQMQV